MCVRACVGVYGGEGGRYAGMRTGGVPAKLVRQFRGGRGPRAVERWCRHDSWRTFVYSLHVHMCFLPLCTSAKSAQPTAAFCKSNHPRSCNVLPSLTHCFPKGACVALHSTLPSSSSSRPAHSVAGDFLQLPPVAEDGARPRFAFAAKTWRACLPLCVELVRVHRQADPAFVALLNELRWGT